MDRECPAGNLHSDKRMSPTEAAYFAGFIDGEGTITVVRTTRKDRRRLAWQYNPCFMVANSDLDLLLSLRALCGNGRVNSNFHCKLHAHHKTVYQLKFWANQTRHLLPQLIPYLRGKRRQAEALLRFLEHTRKSDGAAKSAEYWQTVENMRVEIANMNTRGDRAPRIADTLTLAPSRQGINQWTKPRESA